MEGPDEENSGGSSYELGKQYMAYLRKHKFKVWIPHSTEEYVKKAMDNLKDFTMQYGTKSSGYFRTAYFDIESQLYRYATVMSAVRDSTREVLDVSIDDVKSGWNYFSAAYADSLIWLNTYTMGSFGVQDLKENEAERVTEVIDWLQKNRAWSSTETNVRLVELKHWMIDKRWFGTTLGTKRFFDKIKEGGYIRSGRRGNDWYVWIGPKGKELLKQSGVKSPPSW
jgi:hypothetical protein